MIEQNILAYGDERIPYCVNPDPKRTTRIAIHVEPDGTVVVDAPLDRSDEMIQKAVHKRARWIANHVFEARERYRHVQPKSYVSGEQILYLGRRYMLKVIQSDQAGGTAKLRGNKLEITTRSTSISGIRAIVQAWYRTRARDYFARQINEQSSRLPWVDKAPPLRLLEMSRQWGSCSSQGQIILNPHLIKAPRGCIEYVVLHELAHLEFHDHGPEFSALLDRHGGDWKKHKRLLDGLVEVLMSN